MISTLQKFLNRWQDVVKQAVLDTENLEQEEESLKEHGYSNEEIEKKVIAIAKQRQAIIVKNLYDDYKRFLSNLMDFNDFIHIVISSCQFSFVYHP